MLLYKFFKLPYTKKILLIESALLLIGARVLLLIAPFNLIRNFLSIRRKSKKPKKQIQIEDIRWSIDAASNHIPFTKSCLVKALVGQILLKENGYNPNLCIGVSKDNENQLDAHAWIDINGKTIIGKTISGYKELIKL